MIQVEGIFAGGAPSLQSKSVTYTANGTATITPDEGYDGLSSVDVTVDVANGGGAGPATLTITSSSFTGNRYGLFVFVNSKGHLEIVNYLRDAFTFPITIKTVLGGMVGFIADGFPGLIAIHNYIGCEIYKYKSTIFALVTRSQASVDLGTMD